jgi:hypothetical protein
MKKLAILLLFTAAVCFSAEEERVNRVFQLKYVDPRNLAGILHPYVFGGVNVDVQLKALTVTTRPDAMPEIEKIIQRFDVPPPPVLNIEVTIYIMSALAQPAATAVPPELDAVVKQLKSTFSYKGYQLIDTQAIRVRAGQGGEASGAVDNGAPGVPKTISQIKFKSAAASADEKGRAMRIDGLHVGLRIPIVTEGKFQYLDTGINTDVDIREGQKVVVGKANMDGSDRASIVVLTAKVVE